MPLVPASSFFLSFLLIFVLSFPATVFVDSSVKKSPFFSSLRLGHFVRGFLPLPVLPTQVKTIPIIRTYLCISPALKSIPGFIWPSCSSSSISSCPFVAPRPISFFFAAVVHSSQSSWSFFVSCSKLVKHLWELRKDLPVLFIKITFNVNFCDEPCCHLDTLLVDFCFLLPSVVR